MPEACGMAERHASNFQYYYYARTMQVQQMLISQFRHLSICHPVCIVYMGHTCNG